MLLLPFALRASLSPRWVAAFDAQRLRPIASALDAAAAALAGPRARAAAGARDGARAREIRCGRADRGGALGGGAKCYLEWPHLFPVQEARKRARARRSRTLPPTRAARDRARARSPRRPAAGGSPGGG